MKRIFLYTIVGAGLAFLGVACKKQLNTSPQTSLLKLVTFSDLQAGLRGVYDGFQSTSYYGNNANSGNPSAYSALPDLMGDDFVETLESLGNWNTMSEMIYASDNGIVNAAFIQPYEIISRANNILQSISPFETGSTDAESKRIKAQAYAIRAHCHFDLMRYFAVDFGRNSSALGVPYVTVFDPNNALTILPSRNTVKENYDFILKDLDSALANFRLGGNTTANTNRAFIDSVTVYAMRARVNYYASQWASVITDANVALGLRPLTNSAGYASMFTTGTEATPSSEVYWAVPSDGTLNPGRATNGTNASYRVTNALTSVINGFGGAYVNSSVTRFNQVSVGGVSRTLCWKYPGIRSFKVYRAGELMLMRAEAKHNVSDITAINDLNDLRINRGVAIGAEVGPALLNAILTLRRVELLGEGHRWFDLRRTTKTTTRLECISSGGQSRAAKCTIASTERGWIFPIPFNQILVNPNLKPNPGY
ncbi:MAG: RagB/SusD family nutrient uptake outer membrane protein [Chitinophagaceae bacterium]|nr:RagB/SusD family nutrient uptake outer membrane protein [Chitinophagaceae bacterium]